MTMQPTMGPTREDVVSRLIGELGYDPRGAALLAEKLERLQSPLREAFLEWWSTGSIPELTAEGYTAQWLMERRGLKPIAAILTLDWLRRDPKAARAAVERGHDRIIR